MEVSKVQNEANTTPLDEGLTSDAIQKYKVAAEIADEVMEHLIEKMKPGAVIFELCKMADALIEEKVSKVYNKGAVEKGVAFPVCISLNECAGNFSPLADSKETLKEGDLAKVDLAVHVDGLVASCAHTILVSENSDVVLTGKKADVVAAAFYASEIAQRLLKEGSTNNAITEAISKVAEIFHVNPVEGVLSHQVSKFQIDGEKVILNRLDVESTVEEAKFRVGEAYCIDIVMSTGEGKTKEKERTTIYKRDSSESYNLKIKSSRSVMSEIIKKFSAFPFCLRSIVEPNARLGMVEILNHGLVQSYPALFEKDGEFVAQVKFTALITSNGTQRITQDIVPKHQSQYTIEDAALKGILSQSVKKVAKSKAKKKTETPAAASTSAQ